MQVTHPRAGDAPLPGRATVNGTDYPIEDGVVEAPAEDAHTLADAWADRYGVKPETLVREEDGPPDYETIPADLEAMTYDELYDVAADHDISGRSEMNKAELIAALQEV